MNTGTVMVAAVANVMPLANASGLFVSLFTAQEPDGVFGQTGAPSGSYVDVAGLVDIPCTAPPETQGSIQATEVRALEEITSSELHHVLLNGYYPTLDQGWRGELADATGAWICQITWKGEPYAYNIMGVESDSQSTQTRVKVKLATV